MWRDDLSQYGRLLACLGLSYQCSHLLWYALTCCYGSTDPVEQARLGRWSNMVTTATQFFSKSILLSLLSKFGLALLRNWRS